MEGVTKSSQVIEIDCSSGGIVLSLANQSEPQNEITPPPINEKIHLEKTETIEKVSEVLNESNQHEEPMEVEVLVEANANREEQKDDVKEGEKKIEEVTQVEANEDEQKDDVKENEKKVEVPKIELNTNSEALIELESLLKTIDEKPRHLGKYINKTHIEEDLLKLYGENEESFNKHLAGQLNIFNFEFLNNNTQDEKSKAENEEEDLDSLLKNLEISHREKIFEEFDIKVKEQFQSFYSIRKMEDKLEDEVEVSRKLHENMCPPTYNRVVWKTIEIDAEGRVKTILKSDEETSSEQPPPLRPSPSPPSLKNQSNRPGPASSKIKPLSSPLKPQLNSSPTKDQKDIEEVGLLNKSSSSSSGTTVSNSFQLAPTPKILPRMIPAVNKKVYAMKSSSLSFWVPAKVLETIRNPSTNQLEFRVEFEGSSSRKNASNGSTGRVMSAKHLAFSLQTPFVLPVGARVIAKFRDELENETKCHGDNKFYAGIIAERPIPTNNNRYLIFFDDGYAQYVEIENVLWVCESSKEVWNDVHPNSQEFIKEYLKKYPERPMVRLTRGTIVTTEWNGKWWVGRVVEVDCSLVKIHFEADNRYEWIYRGSTRLSPLYNKLKRQEILGTSSNKNSKGGNTNNDKIRQTARKSTSGGPPTRFNIQNSPQKSESTPSPVKKMQVSSNLAEYEGTMARVPLPGNIQGPIPYEFHTCKPSCVRSYNEDDPQMKILNPLLLPIYLGWDREIVKSPRRSIFYRAPCGKRIRDYDELLNFLSETKYNMGIDHFCFDFAVDCFNEFSPNNTHYLIADITYGVEKVPVQCCNSIDHDYPEYVEYSKDRTPGTGVSINTNPEFLSCCDCTDDCADKEKCACWQMTIKGYSLSKMARADFNQDVGYQNRRLLDHVITGIYECNSRCSCRKSCLNRVVQHDMKWQLQIFKTVNKGWAIRPIHDIPQGAFICIYAGQLLTEHGANEDGKAFGDEYLAELDYIEVCESVKEGFESDAIDPDDDESTRRRSSKREEDDGWSGDEDDDLSEDVSFQIKKGKQKEYTLRTKRKDGEESSSKDESSADETVSKINTLSIANPNRKKTRELFDDEDYCYIMDAKSVGNIGRYLNHSCSPNVFVQNVFVDTHDLRFPWVSFFAYKHIKAGTELTWDYSYDIGSVPGKTMFCYCGTPDCRGRLL